MMSTSTSSDSKSNIDSKGSSNSHSSSNSTSISHRDSNKCGNSTGDRMVKVWDGVGGEGMV